MQCPFCQAEESRVVDSRPSDGEIRRRRECLHCEARFTTYERVAELDPVVVKRDGRREPFQREKLLAGLEIAAIKRPIPRRDLDAIADGIERRIAQGLAGEVESRQIGEWALERLTALDQVAAVRFASVFRAPADLEALRRELAAVATASAPPPAASAGGDGDQPALPGIAVSPRSPGPDAGAGRGAARAGRSIGAGKEPPCPLSPPPTSHPPPGWCWNAATCAAMTRAI